jgi:purine nucleoside phosphorylase
MIDAGIFTGSGFYDLDAELLENKQVSTEYGEVQVDIYDVAGKQVGHIARHGKKHERLPNMINHRANVSAFSQLGAGLIIGTTVCGITNPEIDLGKLLLFTDLYYPDNRLPDGGVCTFYTEPGDAKRGHYLFGSPFHLETIQKLSDRESVSNVTYGYVNGPRFNTQAEIRMIGQYCDAVSQTAGPECILSGELEIPYVLLGFGVDYANGVAEEPTPVETLNSNMEKSTAVFAEIIDAILKNMDSPEFDGFIYRFE